MKHLKINRLFPQLACLSAFLLCFIIAIIVLSSTIKVEKVNKRNRERKISEARLQNSLKGHSTNINPEDVTFLAKEFLTSECRKEADNYELNLTYYAPQKEWHAVFIPKSRVIGGDIFIAINDKTRAITLNLSK